MLLSAATPAQQPIEASVAVRGLDPVELCNGREVAGVPELTRKWGKFTYRFATAANRDAFAADEERWGIQLGGGCGSMGPLSGVGDPDRFVVHEGRIYIFASDACRDGFLAAPHRFVDGVDPLPGATPEAVASGRALLERLLEASGGAERVDALRNVHLRIDKETEYQGKKVANGSSLLAVFPDRLRLESWWGDQRRADVVLGDHGFVGDGGEIWSMSRSQIVDARRRFQHHPLAILRARTRPDFFVASFDDDAQGKKLFVWYDGTATTLELGADHRAASVAFRGRDDGGPVGQVVQMFGDYREVDGVTLPFKVEASFDGKPRPRSTRVWTTIEVDAEVEATAFVR